MCTSTYIIGHNLQSITNIFKIAVLLVGIVTPTSLSRYFRPIVYLSEKANSSWSYKNQSSIKNLYFISKREKVLAFKLLYVPIRRNIGPRVCAKTIMKLYYRGCIWKRSIMKFCMLCQNFKFLTHYRQFFFIRNRFQDTCRWLVLIFYFAAESLVMNYVNILYKIN